MSKNRIPKTKAKRVRRRVRNHELKAPVRVSGALDFSYDHELRSLPDELRYVDKLTVDFCSQLRSLPRDLKVDVMYANGCHRLHKLPNGLRARK
ncbi:MAG: hypothetical protein AAF125_13610, partial [Chloroflexota bacterium]